MREVACTRVTVCDSDADGNGRGMRGWRWQWQCEGWCGGEGGGGGTYLEAAHMREARCVRVMVCDGGADSNSGGM